MLFPKLSPPHTHLYNSQPLVSKLLQIGDHKGLQKPPCKVQQVSLDEEWQFISAGLGELNVQTDDWQVYKVPDRPSGPLH